MQLRSARNAFIGFVIAVALVVVGNQGAQAETGALVSDPSCTTTDLARNDDSSSAQVSLPFALNFYGTTYSSLWVNNNGNVTFNGALATFTPFGLRATSTPIIAPFFADVDTRGVGSDLVRYGYGQTTYEGRPAFCVNWSNVGYYASHADKLNTFQLLLVSRADQGVGAFDIIFNYDKVQWETGDASGGSNGMGGVPARAGFSSGSPTNTDQSTELPGSGTSGSFLDNSSNGLIHGHLGSNIDGRYIFPVRSSGVIADTYVAMGDSYQSGEGAYDYATGTDVNGVNQCHRSANAYPNNLVNSGAVRLQLNFVACSGATLSDMVTDDDHNGTPENEVAQIKALSASTRLVTVGVVGNDLNFGGTVHDCIISSITNSLSSCQRDLGADVDAKIKSLETGPIKKDLRELYRLIRAKAPYARVVVVSYPEFFPAGGSQALNCGWIARTSDQIWMNSQIKRADTAIGKIASSVGLEYANMDSVFAGHEQCADREAMNGVVPNLISPAVESYHPNAYGHQLMATRVQSVLNTAVTPTFNILPQQTVIKKFTVVGKTLSVAVAWPGSDVVSTLISPSGVQYTRDVPNGSDHFVGATSEGYVIDDPESGEWTLSSYGADVAPTGEPVTVTVTDEAPLNQLPTAAFTVSSLNGQYAFSAAGSSDSDGTVATYLWDFGDGTTAEGAQVTHSYSAGTYLPTLVITDNDGGQGFVTGNELTVTPGPGTPLLRTQGSLTLTNTFTGTSGDVEVGGNFECNTSAHVVGDVRVLGNVHLTDRCMIDGSVTAGGTITINGTPTVNGSVEAHGDITIEPSARISGNARTAGGVTRVGGGAASQLKLDGAVLGVISEHATVEAPTVRPIDPVQAPAQTTTWSNFLRAAATTNNAPSWATPFSTSPGCAVAAWPSSMNGATITVAGGWVDARASATSCPKVSFQGMTIALDGDLTIQADAFETLNGFHVTSADGAPHKFTVVTDGSADCQSGKDISFSSNSTADSTINVTLRSAGRTIIHGTSNLTGAVDAGCFSADGVVTLTGSTP